MPPNGPHRAVADRFRFLLRATGLSREEFAATVDGAIEPRSLFSVLSGSRRPSRALAVLIERTWGFRADFLLEGKGEMWGKPAQPEASAAAGPLSVSEREVLEFMRESLSNTRTMEGQLEQARAWSMLFGRLLEVAGELDACGRSTDEADLRIYPLFAKLLYEDCVFMAEKYETVMTLVHRRRVHRLTDTFLRYFVAELPRTVLSDGERDELGAMLGPVLEHRQEALRTIEESIRRSWITIENICRVKPVDELLRASAAGSSNQRMGELLARLAETAPESLRDEAEGLVAELASEGDPAATYWTRLRRLLRDLLAEIETDPPSPVESQSIEELRVRYAALLEPLTA